MLSALIFLFLFSGPKNISLLQKTKSIPTKLFILDSHSSEYELPDLPEESDSDLPDVTVPKQYKYCKFGQSSTKGDDDKRTCKEPPSTPSTAQSRVEPSEVGHDNVSSTTTDSDSSFDICRNNHVQFHLYADDTQLYLSFKPSISNSKLDCITRIEKCINEINVWMTQNLLKLNSDKTEFILFGTRHQLSKVGDISIHIGSNTIKPTNHVRNLGFVMDKLLKNGSHINKITSSCYCTLRNIAKIRPSLDTKSAQLITQALVTSRLDYCNTLLAGSSKYQIDKLQRIQNISCRLICNINRYDHVSPAMRNLHWLKITERIVYKLCLLVYKCRNNLAPKYLTELLPSRTSSRPLRSTHSVNITETYFKNSQCQSSSFSSAGPRAWNSLPTRVKTAQSLNSFKSLLKTHLFTTSYNE